MYTDTANRENCQTKMEFGKLCIVVSSRFNATSTETALDKTKKLILNHVFDSELSENRLDNAPGQSQYTV